MFRRLPNITEELYRRGILRDRKAESEAAEAGEASGEKEK